jgi:hypothetical protein
MTLPERAWQQFSPGFFAPRSSHRNDHSQHGNGCNSHCSNEKPQAEGNPIVRKKARAMAGMESPQEIITVSACLPFQY